MSEALRELRRLGLRAPDELLTGLLASSAQDRWSTDDFCRKLVQLEMRERDGRNLARRSKQANLGTYKSLDQFDWKHPTKIDRARYEWLQQMDFVKRGQNALFRGPPGVGKTTLAQHLGEKALRLGMTVRMSTVASVLSDVLRQESLPAMNRRMKQYVSPDLLILDELGYVPCDSRAADLLFQIIGQRHEKRAVVITTNLAFRDWNKAFPDASCLGALVDRFAQHCHVMDIEAESWRHKSSVGQRAKSASRAREEKPQQPLLEAKGTP